MTKLDVEKEVIKLIVQLFKVDESTLNLETRFVEDLHTKSIQIIELTAMLEYKFDVEIPLREIRDNRTIGQAVDYVKGKIAEKDHLRLKSSL